MDSYTEVCRLCSSTHDLRWVFDKNLPEAAGTTSLKDVIFTISGVEIHYKDVISQKICSECYQLAKITYGFREMSIKSNKILKDRYKTLHQTSYITDCTVKEEGVEPKVAIIPLQAD
ncbi:zinc finger protein Paris isoform X11 [Leptinotarsa decemlineata]|uniref:zinc finger protein Paris isoform X11 n=1 Tax=Leptinotarsa decemlineata TaxID=7539 RepID=UPI003D30A610